MFAHNGALCAIMCYGCVRPRKVRVDTGAVVCIGRREQQVATRSIVRRERPTQGPRATTIRSFTSKSSTGSILVFFF